MHEIVRFVFSRSGSRDGIESDVGLAIFSAECLYGRPRTRLEVSHLIDRDGGRVVMRIRGEAGESALQVFIGLCSARFGEAGFEMERLGAAEVGQ